MKTRRRLSIFSLIVASVFLCLLLVSCGVPTYFVPTFTVSGVTPSLSVTDTFNANYTPDSSITTGDDDYCGMLLLYYVGGITPSENTSIISKFKSTYIPTEYNGASIKLDSIDDPVISYTNSSDEDVNVYAFNLNGQVVDAPKYTYSLDIGSSYSKTVTLTYNDPDTSSYGGEFIEYDDGTKQIDLFFDSSFKPASNTYVWIFAAVSAQGDSFSNTFWSPLRYVGYIVTP